MAKINKNKKQKHFVMVHGVCGGAWNLVQTETTVRIYWSQSHST
jgi:hypothetical protein